MSARYSATRTSLRTGAIMVLFTLVFTALMASTYGLTRPAIEASKQESQQRLVNEVLPPASYDNDLLADTVQVQAPAWLGDDATTVHRATLAGAPSALVFETVAPDGYGGPIRLLLAIDADGRVLGVRVTAHRETPGLGDDIEAGRSDWIRRFQGRALGDPPAAGWAVRKDGGKFDAFTGATITPRAVIGAVHRTLQYVAREQEAIFSLPADTDFDHWQTQGEQLHRRVRRLELPRRQFRRLLEWWLVLDLGHYLCEQGYRVQIAPFCSPALTPRNLLIRAEKI